MYERKLHCKHTKTSSREQMKLKMFKLNEKKKRKPQVREKCIQFSRAEVRVFKRNICILHSKHKINTAYFMIL